MGGELTMGIFHKILGKSDNIIQEDAKFGALRFSEYPMELGARGAYCLGVNNGSAVMAAGLAADSEIFQFRWTDATRFCVLRGVYFSMGSVIAFVAGRMKFDLVCARGWTANGTGGTVSGFTATGTAKKRNDFAVPLMAGNIRVADTAALGAGTKTLDTTPEACIAMGAPTSIGPIIQRTPLWTRDTDSEYPFLFEQDEGFIIRAVVPGTGTWYFGITVEWAEVDPASIPGW